MTSNTSAGQARPKGTSAFDAALTLPWMLWALVLFALIGIGIATYLTFVHYAGVPLACPRSSHVNCELVTSSPYSVIGTSTVPITVPGLGWFIVSGLLAGLGLLAAAGKLPDQPWLPAVQLLWSVAGVISVIYLIYVELVLLNVTICEWCSGVHLLVILSFILTLIRWQRATAERYAKR